MPDARRIALITAREDLTGDVRRLAALAAVSVDVVPAGDQVRSAWRSALLVVVGSDTAPALAAAGTPRRDGVVIVTSAEPDPALWRSAVALGASLVLTLPADERHLVEQISDMTEERTSGGSTVAVIGGCGGAGASTLAAALAVTSARVGSALLVDGDRFGGGLDVLVGAEQSVGTRWPELAGTRGRLSAAALIDALVRVDGWALLSCDRAGYGALSAEAAAAVMAAAARGFRSVVVDLPHALDEVSAVLAAGADQVLVVVPATVRAVAAAATVATRLLSQCAQVRLVVRDAHSGRLSAAEIADVLGLPLATTFRSEASVAAAAERGQPPLGRARGSLHDACRDLVGAAPTRTASS